MADTECKCKNRASGIVKKGWGSENIWATNDKYCGKLLNFFTGSKSSMHFHADKDETWYVLNGKFIVNYINTPDATEYTKILNPGDVWHNPPFFPHQLVCIEEGVIIEVSSPDSSDDNFRIRPGDNQTNTAG